MNIISHRGNLNGRIPERENSPEYIDEAIEAGFEVEIDIFAFEDPYFYLGHDDSDYQVDLTWLEARSDCLWCHCKDIEPFHELIKSNMNCFFIEKEDYVLTSYGYIWCRRPYAAEGNRIIVPAISKKAIKELKQLSPNVFGTFTDYPL